MHLPLHGYRILDLTRNVAGPYCTLILADLGADVVKVERPPAGDDTRAWGPPFWNGYSAMFLALNRNKASLALDMKHRDAPKVIAALIKKADVLVHSFKPKSARKLGIDPEVLRDKYPSLVTCEVTAFGPKGPRRDDPGYDPLLQAFSGLMELTGSRDGDPARVGTSIIDMGTGMWAAISVLAGLLRRKDDGQGVALDTSLFDTAMAWIPYQAIGYFATGLVPRRMGTDLAILSPYGAFSAADGMLVIAAGNDDLWQKTCGALGAPALAADARYLTNPTRVQYRDVLREDIEKILIKWPRNHWIERFQEAGVPCSPINTVEQSLADPHTLASGIIQESEHVDIPTLKTIAPPLFLDGERPPLRTTPPQVGEHTRAVLSEAGFSQQQIEELLSSGAAHQKE